MNDSKKVWITGADGRVGQEILRLLDKMSFEVFATDIDDVDITNMKDVETFIIINRPHYIINCAGFTDVNKCEEDIDKAFKVNALGARNLSIMARKIDARLIYLSTDDVFSGDAKKPYNEFDTPMPKTVYGKSKLAGENYVKEFAPRHIIVRSSWIFGNGDNYLKTILELSSKNIKIEAAQNQIAIPTSAKELAKKIIYLLSNAEDGIYHITCQGECSRYEFAKTIVELTKRNVEVIPVNKNEDSIVSLHPSYSVLDNLMLRLSDIEPLPNWKICLKEYMRENNLLK